MDQMPRRGSFDSRGCTHVTSFQIGPRRPGNPKPSLSQSERKTFSNQEQGQHWHLARQLEQRSPDTQSVGPGRGPSSRARGLLRRSGPAVAAHIPSSLGFSRGPAIGEGHTKVDSPDPSADLPAKWSAASWASRADGLSHAERPTPTHSGVSCQPHPLTPGASWVLNSLPC